MAAERSEAPLARVSLLLFVFLLSLQFGLLRPMFTTEADLSSVEQLCTWTGAPPAQYRVLMPLLINGAQHLAGLVGRDIPYDAAGRAVDVLGLLGFFLAFIALMRSYTREPFALFLSCALLYYSVICNYLISPHYNHRCVYDMPALALFTAALYALRRGRMPLYAAVFALGVLNRETMIFATAAFVLVRRGEVPLRRLIGEAAVQVVYFIAVKALLYWVFRHDQASGLIEDAVHGRLIAGVMGNFRDIFSRDGVLILMTAFGGLWLPAVAIAMGTGDRFLRRLLPVVPLFLAVILVGGNVTELRVYNELVPMVALLLGWRIAQQFAIRDC